MQTNRKKNIISTKKKIFSNIYMNTFSGNRIENTTLNNSHLVLLYDREINDEKYRMIQYGGRTMTHDQ
jgi:hypothetical protein